MSKPIAWEGIEIELVEEKEIGYEHWHVKGGIDNIHHIHLPIGITIEFEHEDSEGVVRIIKEGG